MSYRLLTSRRSTQVEYVTLNRPDVRNALNDEVCAELTTWATGVREDPDVRAVVLAGAGTVFCAGADIEWMSRAVNYSVEENVADATAMTRMFGALDTLPVPVIARVQGGALGGGAGLAAVADIVIADEQAVFGFTETKLGIAPAVIAPFVLAKIGRSAARELFLTGARFSAARAREIGLAHAVVSSGDLDRTVTQYLTEFLTAGPHALAAAKTLIREVWGRAPEDAAALTARAIATLRVSPEGQEGLSAFLERRRPSWSA